MSSAAIQTFREAGWPRLAFQGALALCMLIPVTLPVPVLRVLVHERFGTPSDALAFCAKVSAQNTYFSLVPDYV